MAKPAPMIPVSPKLYRHFAVATVAITACLAVFADGEQRQEIEQVVASRQQQNELQAKEREQARASGRRQMTFTDKRKTTGRFGTDGVQNVYVNDSDVVVSAAELGAETYGYEMTGGVVSSLSEDEEQRKRGVKKPDKAAIESMIAASKARSQTRTQS